MDLETVAVAIKQEIRCLPIHISIGEVSSGKVTKLKEVLPDDSSAVSAQLNVNHSCPGCSCVLNVNIILYDSIDTLTPKEMSSFEETLVPITVFKQDDDVDDGEDLNLKVEPIIDMEAIMSPMESGNDDDGSDSFSDDDNIPIDSLFLKKKVKSKTEKRTKRKKEPDENLDMWKKMVKDSENLPQHVCLMCYDQFNEKADLDQHLENHPLVCKHCGDRTFATPKQLSVHSRRIHSDIRRDMGQFLLCPYCDFYIINYKFIQHVNGCKTVQAKQSTGKKSKKKPLKREKSANSDKHVCVCCYETFKTLSDYKNHMKDHSLVCKFCGRDTYKNHKTLYRHVRIHHGEFRPDTDTFIECPRCGEKIVNQNFSRHIASCPANEKGKPTCGICKKEFAIWRSVFAHIENVHMGTKQYTCELCGAQFSNSGAMENHTIKHKVNDDRPFKCDLCYKSYSVKSSIEKHMQIAHIFRKEPRPVFPCDICGVELVSQKGLKTHKKRHDETKQYQCSFCDRGFVSKAELQNHERTHTGDRPFPCTFCELRFTTKCGLQSHTRLHTGEKPYECEICQQRFSDRGFYRSHIIKHEKELGVVLDKSVRKFQKNYKRPEHFKEPLLV